MPSSRLEEVVGAIGFKERVARELERLLDRESRKRALRDYHARRKPRPCGMTVHTGVGCSFACSYCYIEDMGFSWRPKPYPLTGDELAYALAVNPFFAPGSRGTLVAIGSITEPFLQETREKAFEYIEAISRRLGNPIQFSTKARLDYGDAARLRDADPGISPLVTIVTLRHYRKLEPRAPDPWERLETIRSLARAGLKPVLFYRPIIPGVNDEPEEYEEILREARRAGAIGVVAGSLRATERILSRLEKLGLNTAEIRRRMRGSPSGGRQVDVDTRDIKERILGYARRIGLVAFPMACMANLYTHGRTCLPMIARGVIPSKGVQHYSIDRGEIVRISRLLGVTITSMRLRGNGVLDLSIKGDPAKAYLLAELVKGFYGVCARARTP